MQLGQQTPPKGAQWLGRTIKVVKGRSAPIGSTGVVFWARVCRYGKIRPGVYSRVTTRLGVATSERRDDAGNLLDAFWTYSDNVADLGTDLACIDSAGFYLLRQEQRQAEVPF